MVDYCRLICPRPSSPILWRGCNTNGCSLPHVPPTGYLTIFKNSIPRPMLVVPFAMRNGSNKHFVKTNKLLACCLQNCLGGPSFSGLAPARNVPTRIGSGRSTNCGSTSATASRRQPDNTILMSKLLAKKRRLLTTNASSMSMLQTNASRLPARRPRLHVTAVILSITPYYCFCHPIITNEGFRAGGMGHRHESPLL